jgi:selenocysteine lyase/cysteine desulfurase
MSAALADGSGYFLYHSIGMFPHKGELIGRALADFSTGWGSPDDSQWNLALRARAHFIDSWRALIQADAGTLTNTENVTTALYSIINALPLQHRASRRFLIAADCFPSLHFVLSGMAQRHGFELHTVPLRPGETWVREEDILRHWTPEVSVALLTSVTSTASYRCDLAALIDHGRRMGSLVGVDITQSIGLFPFDVRVSGVDFVVSSSLKWLGGTSGAGILYVNTPLLEQCRPVLRGWFSQADIFSWDLDAFRYAPDARRFDTGTPAILACVGTLPALKWHAAQDASALLAHNRALSAQLLAAGTELGLAAASPAEDGRRGGSTMLRLPAEKSVAVLAALRAEAIYADCRGSTLRLSPGNMTTQAGIDRLVQVLARSLR